MSEYAWRTSTALCGVGGCGCGCVEVVASSDAILVRDSKDPKGPVLSFTFAEMAAWIAGCKAGEFDDLVEDSVVGAAVGTVASS